MSNLQTNRKWPMLLAGLFMQLVTASSFAQPKPGAAYFAGTWKVLIKGTPDGDAKMFVVLAAGDSSMVGLVKDSTGKEISTISRIELTDTSAMIYFTAQGYDVNLLMKKKDDDHITGSLMDMFDALGDRVNVTK